MDDPYSTVPMPVRAGAAAPLTLEMVNAGLSAFREWNPTELEAAGMVCEVFFAMLAAAPTASQAQF
jgi:hypothetical protein